MKDFDDFIQTLDVKKIYGEIGANTGKRLRQKDFPSITKEEVGKILEEVTQITTTSILSILYTYHTWLSEQKEPPK